MNPLEVAAEIAEASTLPSSFYKDPEMYERSKEAVFARSWQLVGDTDDLKAPGTVKPFTLLEGCLDEPLVATRDYEDQLHVLSNVCTHRGMLVAETGDNARYLRCRYHGRRFGLDGCFQAMPEFEGVRGFPSAKDHLAKVSFGSWGRGKFLFVSLNPAAPLEQVLQPVQERLGWLPLHEFRYEASRARDYLVRANWALYCDNYLEGFHIPFIHASLNTAIDYGNYSSELYEWCNLQLGVAASGEIAFDLPKASPDYGRRIGAYYYWVFPNLMLNFYPWGLSINVVRPLGPELTKVSFLPYVWDSSKLDSGAGAGLDRVEREDEVVVEAVQKGVKSRFYDRGRFSVVREQGVHHFHRLLARELG
ncbi:aromatic ring-hydroxylating oxygenase subunit alpha [Meiothermus granaticius]|uniref:Methanesulfonate monooxygenase hydroxylase subunit alpha n=1 Tax=Meiothermus granaticius NBRC 107808 TaxID=1227551 RepID=A0A399FA67_9DEIN|nr:aromatic ring-hydroxylating dioxygenase subunit alpha [Meiothermus granaticius]RIH91802.1 Methanesulfonate monooxygenase hydroxylase subunit alpha [Meiothermus granaticius NBRC 107808]GEM87906.1 choline monooxygenase [Meiothermus granaticius NBRC 107808]